MTVPVQFAHFDSCKVFEWSNGLFDLVATIFILERCVCIYAQELPKQVIYIPRFRSAEWVHVSQTCRLKKDGHDKIVISHIFKLTLIIIKVEDLFADGPSCLKAHLFFCSNLFHLRFESFELGLQHDFAWLIDEADCPD